MIVINLTQHQITREQKSAGVFDAPFGHRGEEVKGLLTFEGIPSMAEMEERAKELASIACYHGADSAMIGGAPWFMSTLEKALIDEGIKPCYAFSKRVVEEKDGVKTSTFNHLGFFWVSLPDDFYSFEERMEGC